VACDTKEPPPAQETTVASTTTTAEPAPEPESSATTSTADNWMQVPEDDLNQAQIAQLDRAKAAQMKLGGTLLKALSTSINENGAAASVAFCKEKAPLMAADVAKSTGVKIGRTSAKLRNPENSGPAWVENATRAADDAPATFAGPQGELGYLAPISTAQLCTTCHGTAQDIPDDVATALNEAYPEDQARGFAEGDRRGWFWVAVPPPS
jgi:hypothetical protein